MRESLHDFILKISAKYNIDYFIVLDIYKKTNNSDDFFNKIKKIQCDRSKL